MSASWRTAMAFLGLAGSALASDLTVHEWGTFTSVVGSDGRMLSGLEAEEERVPNFVHSFQGFAPANKGWNRPVHGVTVKMETPVLYFYSPEPIHVRVDVGFNGGSISQWYPDRSAGESFPPAPAELAPNANPATWPPFDFSAGYRGQAVWEADILAPGTTTRISAPRDWETPQWSRARVPGANLVRSGRDEVEGFIFYRGLGHFALPLEVTADARNAVTLRNGGRDDLAFVWVYERPVHPGGPARRWCGRLPAGAQQVVTADAADAASEGAFQAALVVAGLTADEARALRATWRESYFDRPGLRIFWIVPRAFTDAVLPIAIEPQPTRLERVLVGRTEVLSPSFEAELVRDFATDGGQRWAGDRYFSAYRERAENVRAAVGVAGPASVK